jgi:rhamnosyltransferase subunit B
MKVLITALGSSGDVNPSIAIGSALRKRGHAVRLLVNPFYKRQVSAAGLELVPLGSERQFQQVRDSPLLKQPRRGSGWRELVLPNVPLVVEALEAEVRHDRPDAVVYHPLTLGARWVCERHSILCALASLSPLVWMSCEDGSVHARSFASESPPRWLLWAHLRLARPYLRLMVDRTLNPIRERFGFPPARDIFFDHVRGCDANLGMWSPAFRGPMPDDPPNARICGFTWFDRGHDVETAGDEVERFLSEGEPPIVFTMGTTLVSAAGSFYEQAAEACRRLGRRGMLLTGLSENTPRRLPPGVKAFLYAPFSRVLSRGCATVHHGGAGTTAQAMRAGKPTVVVPVAYDQFDNASRLKRLGVSATLRRARVSPANLATALRRVLKNPVTVERARRLGAKLEQEDGAAAAATAIEAVVGARWESRTSDER